MAINVVFWDEDANDFHAIHTSKRLTTASRIVDILYCNIGNNIFMGHYICIRDIHRLIRKKYYKDGKASRDKKVLCRICHLSFSGQVPLAVHTERCRKNDPQKVIVPAEGDTVHFTSFDKKFDRPCFGVADFEVLKKIIKNIYLYIYMYFLV